MQLSEIKVLVRLIRNAPSSVIKQWLLTGFCFSSTGACPGAAVTRGAEQLLKFRGDGMIVATPTGSTAYSRSAGGPVLTPDSGCFSLTPICAHTPGTAPIVVPDGDTYMVSITDTGRDSADVLADGVPLGSLNEPLSIRRHDQNLRLLRRKEP